MNVKSIILVRSVIRKLIEAMELLNTIPEDDFRILVNSVRLDKANCKGILDNAGRGNIFMVLFFLREALERVSNRK